MNTPLTPQEIQRLFVALKKKGVEYIDVQHELVDHLASDIELSKETHPLLNFEEHMDLALSKFPKDIKKIVRSKEKSMNRYWQRKTFSFMKSYFQFPTIIFTISLYMIIVMGSLFYGAIVLNTTLIFMILAMVIAIIKSYKNSNYTRENEKKYLVLRMFFGQTMTMLILPSTLLNVLHLFKPEDGNLYSQNWAICIVSAIAVFTLMWCHACLTDFPKMLQEELNTKYPYLTLAN